MLHLECREICAAGPRFEVELEIALHRVWLVN